MQNTTAKISNTAKKAAQALANKIANESNETIKDIGEQLGVIDSQPNPNQQGTGQTDSSSQPSPSEEMRKQVDSNRSKRMLEALNRELAEIKQRKEYQVVKQKEYDEKQRQQELTNQQEPLIQSSSKQGRKFGMRAKIKSSIDTLMGKNQAEVKNASST